MICTPRFATRARLFFGAALLASVCLAGYSGALAQKAPKAQKKPPAPQVTAAEKDYRETINANTVTVLGASISGAYIKIVDDIAKAVNDGNNLRVLPIVGEGGSQNIRDILYLKNVDVGIVMSTSLDVYNGKPLFENLPSRLQYIARLYEEEFHIIGGKEVSSVSDLAGKKVGFHGGAFVSGQELLGKLKIKPGEAVQVDFFAGLEQIRKGELAAIVRATASPMKDLNEKFDPQVHHFVPIPLEDALIESHLPAKLTHKHYPKIIADGQRVETVAIGVVLAAYPWPRGSDRYRRVAKFTDALFSNISKLLADKERHPKWDDVNLAASLPGWTRFPAAEEWLKKHGATLPTASAGSPVLTTAVEGRHDLSLAAPENREKLFREFEEWQKAAGR